jgi:hypothetical protein
LDFLESQKAIEESEKPLKKVKKAVEESQKAIEESRKPLKRAESH